MKQLNEKAKLFIGEDEAHFILFVKGRKVEENCRKAPITCKLIESFEPAKTCTRGQVKFSLIQPGVRLYPHCGPTNCRLRAHLGLHTPDGSMIRVANETRKWYEGKVIVFDDSFEHEIWHEGDTHARLVLSVDVWHPDLSEAKRKELSPI